MENYWNNHVWERYFKINGVSIDFKIDSGAGIRKNNKNVADKLLSGFVKSHTSCNYILSIIPLS